jgi:organic radical activating enzyme
MSCIYCWDGFSSKIEQENVQFGNFSSNGIEIKNTGTRHPQFDQLVEKFWQWMENNSHQLRRFHILGGEPLYQEQFETCLEFLETHSNPELEFNIISNLKVTPARLEKVIDRIQNLLIKRCIKRFDLTCSIDCWGQEQEYVRWGLDLQQWNDNFEFLLKKKWLTLNINQTIMCLTIKTMPELLTRLELWRIGTLLGT